jgi:hypothetical protein
MPQSRSLPRHIQLVQMVGRLIPTYNQLEPANVGGTEFLFCQLSPDRSDQRSARCRANPIGSLAPSIAVLPQSGVEAVDQGFSGEGLGQKTGCSRLRSSCASVLDRESRDENERHPVSLGKQVGLQLETAHRWHLNICYHARGVIEVRRPQELLGRGECMNDVSKRPHEIVGRDANGAVIVND